MTPLRLLTLLSVGANLALATVWWTHRETPADLPAVPVASLATPAVAAAPDPPRPAAPAPAGGGADAASVSASELEEVFRHLQQAGFPRREIISILHAWIGERMRVHFAALGWQDQPYWKAPDPGRSMELARATTRQQREISTTLIRLLGEDYLNDAPEMLEMLQQQYGPLPAAKLVRVQALQEDYNELRVNLSLPGAGPLDQERRRLLDQEQRADLAALLSPQELLEYDLRHSPTSHRLRLELGAAQPSEAEFRSLFTIYQALDQQFPINASSGQPPDATLLAARRAAEERALEQVKLTLGPARAAELAQARDPQARQENQLVARLGLPLSAAAEVVAIKRELNERGGAFRRDQTLNDAQRQEQLRALVDVAERRLTATLGARGLSAYREYGGEWLRHLAPPPAR